MLFSIIVPMYNVEKYIDNCINSLIKQSFNSFEIILIDDGSTDNTLIKAKKWENVDTRIKLISKDYNSGLSDARNIGIKSSAGKYILFVDSDDYLENDSLKMFENIISEKSPDIIYAGYIQENEYENIQYKKYGFISECDALYTAEEYMYSELNKRNLFAAAAFGVYKKSFILENELYFKCGILHEDEQWTPRVLMHANSIYLSSFHFYHYLKRQGSITTKRDRTKNGIDLMNTCVELDLYAKRIIEDAKLLKLYNNQLAKLYMKAVCIGRIYRPEYKNKINKKFPIKHACKCYDILKAILFATNLYLYSIVDGIVGDDWR